MISARRFHDVLDSGLCPGTTLSSGGPWLPESTASHLHSWQERRSAEGKPRGPLGGVTQPSARPAPASRHTYLEQSGMSLGFTFRLAAKGEKMILGNN